jgi:hypothetical protein
MNLFWRIAHLAACPLDCGVPVARDLRRWQREGNWIRH